MHFSAASLSIYPSLPHLSQTASSFTIHQHNHPSTISILTATKYTADYLLTLQQNYGPNQNLTSWPLPSSPPPSSSAFQQVIRPTLNQKRGEETHPQPNTALSYPSHPRSSPYSRGYYTFNSNLALPINPAIQNPQPLYHHTHLAGRAEGRDLGSRDHPYPSIRPPKWQQRKEVEEEKSQRKVLR